LYHQSESLEHGKPEPDIFLAAADRIGVPPQECIVIEDSINGIKAGHAAGMKVVPIDHIVQIFPCTNRMQGLFSTFPAGRRCNCTLYSVFTDIIQQFKQSLFYRQNSERQSNEGWLWAAEQLGVEMPMWLIDSFKGAPNTLSCHYLLPPEKYPVQVCRVPRCPHRPHCPDIPMHQSYAGSFQLKTALTALRRDMPQA